MPVAANIFANVSGTPITPQFAEYVVKGSAVESDGGSKPFVNIFHFVRTTGPGTMTEAELYTAVSTLIDAAYGACLSTTYVPGVTTVRFMDDPVRAAVVMPNAIAGTQAGDRMTTFNSSVIRKNTWARGRSYRGSNHYGPLAESDSLLDNLTVAALARLATLAGILQDLGTTVPAITPDGSEWRLFVLSTVLSDMTVSPIKVTGSWVKETISNKRIGTMKRRKDRTGPSN